MNDYYLMVEEHPNPQDIEFIRKSLAEHNITHSNIHESRALAVFLYNDHEEIVGGVTGETWGACLEVKYLWLHPQLRGQDYGQQLMKMLEREAVKRGCREAILDTFSFQSPDFYQKMGYEIWGVISSFPYNKFFMRKTLGLGHNEQRNYPTP
jgi:GNAT superfamily N-acetyltransferase